MNILNLFIDKLQKLNVDLHIETESSDKYVYGIRGLRSSAKVDDKGITLNVDKAIDDCVKEFNDVLISNKITNVSVINFTSHKAMDPVKYEPLVCFKIEYGIQN